MDKFVQVGGKKERSQLLWGKPGIALLRLTPVSSLPSLGRTFLQECFLACLPTSWAAFIDHGSPASGDRLKFSRSIPQWATSHSEECK